MALDVWTKQSGASLGTFTEQTSVNIALPIGGALTNPSYTGQGHHPVAPLRNSAGAPFIRNAVNSYVDGIYQMRNDLPNARTVSNLVVWDQVNQGNQADPDGYSGFMYAFGQFLTHDLEFARPGSTNIDVVVPAGDTNLTPGSHIPVNRSAIAPGTGIAGHTALPINDVTGWIDCSVVYGLDYPPGVPQGPTVFQNPINLREGGQTATTGKLSTSSNGQYAPVVNNSFVFGDPRGTENPDLTSIQTLFIREHNWHVDRLKKLHPTWTGEQLYQRARNIVIAEFQNITYKEWLPKIVGASTIPAYTGFKTNIDASVTVEFAVAAMRFGHSIVSGAQDRVDEQGNITESLTLSQAFFLTPDLYERNGGANGFIRKLASDISNKLDVHIIEDLRNLLNDPPAAMDLAATNIQRGRDTGLPSLNQMRTALGLSAYTSFSQITTDSVVASALQTAYTNINNIDLWVGGLAETPVPGAMVGQTFQNIISSQMIRLRDGDALYWENQPWAPGDFDWLQSQTLSKIILRNTDTVRMQLDAFVAVERSDLYLPTAINGVDYITTDTAGGVNYPATDPAAFTYKVISGALPGGLQISGSRIIGYPYIVATDTTFTFCIRASNGVSIADRTFSITTRAVNVPTFVTAAGALPVGIHQQLYALDRTYVNYKIEAFDLDEALGNILTYYIASGDGSLPPGLSMDSTGLITGYIKPTLKITPADGKGTYDESTYDAVAYDFATLSTNGFDTYFYDDVFYDYNLPDGQPISLNVNYQFKVTVTDGYKIAQRIFRIFVVGDDTFRADNTSLDGFVGNQGFTADATYLRQPVWLSNPNLGIFRASNYLTIPVALYDNNNVYYNQEVINREVRVTSINISNTDNSFRSNHLTVTNVKGNIAIGQYICFEGIIPGATGQTYRISNVINLGNGVYRVYISSTLLQNIPDGTIFYIGTLCSLPPGMSFDLNTAQLYGNVPYQPAITTIYTFTLTATRPGNKGDSLSSSRTFTITIIGEIDSVITWNTPSNLGTIHANYISTLRVSATTTILNAVVLYTVTQGVLPNGLTLTTDGEIIGKVIQFPDPANNVLGLTSFDHGNLTFDLAATTVDRSYSFTVEARDQFGYSAVSRTFTVNIDVPNAIAYSNIRVQPYLNNTQRTAFKSFMNNTTVFAPQSIYRSNDPNFGLQYNLSMVAYAGIQTNSAAKLASAMGLNHKRKRFIFNSVETAVAYLPGTTTAVYEVVYLKMLDPLEPNGLHLPTSIKSRGHQSDTITIDSVPNLWSRNLSDLTANAPSNSRPLEVVTADSTGYQISNSNVSKFFPSSITNWQYRIGQTGLTERNYLPLWMRSIQPGTKQEIGFVLAVPICYCLVGKSAGIKLLIENSGFDFKDLDYTVDRYIIDSVTGYTSDKYLVFKNDRITV
jgi:hypothetical protein